jgi:hypothetical protein
MPDLQSTVYYVYGLLAAYAWKDHANINAHTVQYLCNYFTHFMCFKAHFVIVDLSILIAGHRHRGRCRRYRHSGILYLSPVPEHSGTGLDPYSGTLLVPSAEFMFIPLQDWLDAAQSEIPAFKKAVVGSGDRIPSARPNWR